MSQLLEFKVKPFESIHFRQNARLVSEDMLVIEKQKALARRTAFAQKAHVSADADMRYVSKVHRTFSSAASSVDSKAAPEPAAPVVSSIPNAAAAPKSTAVSGAGTGSGSEAQAAYTQQRGALEVRAASGDVAFIPVIEMTIITSWPEVDFTYTGGFQYVPPSADPAYDSQVNLII